MSASGSSMTALGASPGCRRPHWRNLSREQTRASFDLLFRFTCRGDRPMPRPSGGSFAKLPSNWVIA